jgi:hypothetical protein
LQAIKRKYGELLNQTEREARQRAAEKRVNDMFGREERAGHREGQRRARCLVVGLYKRPLLV